MDKGLELFFDETSQSVDLESSYALARTGVKHEPCFEEQQWRVEAESSVNGRVQVKMEREEKEYVMQSAEVQVEMEREEEEYVMQSAEVQVKMEREEEEYVMQSAEVQVEMEREEEEHMMQSAYIQVKREKEDEYLMQPADVQVEREEDAELMPYDEVQVEIEGAENENMLQFEDLQVKREREEDRGVVYGVPDPEAFVDHVLNCGAAEDSSEDSSEDVWAGQEVARWEMSTLNQSCILPGVKSEGLPETALASVGSLGLAQGEQCMEGAAVCQQEQAVDRSAGPGLYSWYPQVLLEGGGMCRSVDGGEEEGWREKEGWKGEEGWEGGDWESGGQPQISLMGCKVAMNPESASGGTFMERPSEEGLKVEGGLHLQATAESSVTTAADCPLSSDQWSDPGTDPVQTSSIPGVPETRSCVTSQETLHTCHQSVEKFPLLSFLLKTMTEHVAPKEFKNFSCRHCQFKFPSDRQLRLHVKVVHEGVTLVCPHCEYFCKYKYLLRRHIKAVHEFVKRPRCPHCDYRAGFELNLVKHIEIVHEGLRTYKCPHCSYRDGQKANVKKHLKCVHRDDSGDGVLIQNE